MIILVNSTEANAITKNNANPLPSIKVLLLKVKESKFLATLDLKACLDDENDIIVVGATVEELKSNLIQVLETLRRHGMKINVEKCKFFQAEVEFLGHLVISEGLKPCANKVVAMKVFPRPKHAKDVASFLGLAGYCRKFIRNFGQIARPLDALRKQPDFQWGEKEEEAFQKFKDALMSDELLAYPRFDRPFSVTTDASDIAIGGVISQIDDEDFHRSSTINVHAEEERDYKLPNSLDRVNFRV
ncbi:uncharacterized protein LOC135199077 [Macrobrachium nipponense]|uniref:uncharacterized protein LOC135199077 n=1 Tax=Macrobrachium nipponense TaxID=159736 RepID=UPI0030C8AC59